LLNQISSSLEIGLYISGGDHLDDGNAYHAAGVYVSPLFSDRAVTHAVQCRIIFRFFT
jgi:hypothetical protein